MNLLKRIYFDPLIRRFLVACLCAGAFVWVAVDSFDVDSEVVLEFFLLSIALVAVLIGLASLSALFMVLLRKLIRRTTEMSVVRHTDDENCDRSEGKPGSRSSGSNIGNKSD